MPRQGHGLFLNSIGATMNSQEMKQHVLQALIEAGWEPVSELSMQATVYVAQKRFATSVGTKVALATFRDVTDECCCVGGEYLSEGTNVLSTGTAYILYMQRPEMAPDAPLFRHALRENVTDNDLRKCAMAFAAEAELRIGESFAVRLMRRNLAKAS
ncbi:hypothetical protein APB26_32430 [Pseudomonas aeruginosa]|nr:hypothetical protein APB26_32430 [Pseudomonas aeruginosa]RPV61361.1 hypothetical protein IPC838_18760 [Pseudomonas aeruginosa]